MSFSCPAQYPVLRRTSRSSIVSLPEVMLLFEGSQSAVVVSLPDVTLLFEGGHSVVVSGVSPADVMLLFEAGDLNLGHG